MTNSTHSISSADLCTVNGMIYEAHPTTEGNHTCRGCAGEKVGSLICKDLGPCTAHTRLDNQYVIWVKSSEVETETGVSVDAGAEIGEGMKQSQA